MKRKAILNLCSVQAALKNYRDSIGKTTQRHHYINEVRLIHYALTGRAKAISDFKPATREKRKLYTQVLFIDCELISKGIDYQLRKQVCRQVAEKQKTKYPI